MSEYWYYKQSFSELIVNIFISTKSKLNKQRNQIDKHNMKKTCLIQSLQIHNISVKITYGVIKSWWDERVVFVSDIPESCVTPQGPLWPGWPCWVDTLMTLWLGIYPCVCWPSEGGISLLQHCTRKHKKKHVFFNVFKIWLFGLIDVNQYSLLTY